MVEEGILILELHGTYIIVLGQHFTLHTMEAFKKVILNPIGKADRAVS